MDFNGIADKLGWLYQLLGGAAFGSIIIFIGLFMLRKYIKELKEKIKDLGEKAKELQGIKMPDSITYELTVVAKDEFAKIKTENSELIEQKLNPIETKVDAIVETLAASRSTPIDRSQALMTLINKPVPKKQVIRIEKKPELFKPKSEQKGGGNYLEVD